MNRTIAIAFIESSVKYFPEKNWFLNKILPVKISTIMFLQFFMTVSTKYESSKYFDNIIAQYFYEIL